MQHSISRCQDDNSNILDHSSHTGQGLQAMAMRNIVEGIQGLSRHSLDEYSSWVRQRAPMPMVSKIPTPIVSNTVPVSQQSRSQEIIRHQYLCDSWRTISSIYFFPHLGIFFIVFQIVFYTLVSWLKIRHSTYSRCDTMCSSQELLEQGRPTWSTDSYNMPVNMASPLLWLPRLG